ncbi:faciogenital dysplasia protein [Anaeramoeba flamelloides]|uniref:Faciogenital dysplasia protein n=1 Tax=Anaeramoeba flamelloides TaxID=1746091 RepID=A0AAV8A6Z5_9EUKA|nr:faciogenital dysplasia protein [Anaeramoeba flamelloides]
MSNSLNGISKPKFKNNNNFLIEKQKKLIPQISKLKLQNPNESLPEEVDTTHLKCKKDKIIEELYKTEYSYLKHLKILLSKMDKELFDKNNKNCLEIESEELKKLFLNLRWIYQVNALFFNTLTEKIVNWDENSKIGDFFMEYIPYLKMYQDYFRNFDVSQKHIIQILQKSKKFVKWELEKRKKYGHDLCSLLIMPIQRLPRYELFLKGLVNITLQKHHDFEDLTKSFKMILEVNKKLNESIKNELNQKIMLELQNRLSSSKLENIVVPHRTFIQQGSFTKMKGKTMERRNFYLFSDVLITEAIVFGSGLIDDVLYLKETIIEDLPKQNKVENAFLIISKENSFIAAFDEYKMKKYVYYKMKKTVSQLKKKIKSFYIKNNKNTTEKKKSKTKNNIRNSPVWIPDCCAMECASCRMKFTMIKRRHHCRECGLCVCQKCSSHTALLPYRNKTRKVRVCDRCFFKIVEEQEKIEIKKKKKKI